MDLATICALAAPVLSAALTWKVARRKSNADIRKTDAEAKGIEIDNMDAVLKLWRELVSDLTYQVDEMRKEVIVFRRENVQLKDEIVILQRQNNELKLDIKKLKELISSKA